jgi:hypothetical protein
MLCSSSMCRDFPRVYVVVCSSDMRAMSKRAMCRMIDMSKRGTRVNNRGKTRENAVALVAEPKPRWPMGLGTPKAADSTRPAITQPPSRISSLNHIIAIEKP